jgi:type I restriction enzyme R subunit
MLRGTCDRARLLDLVENFTLFSEHKAGLVKIIGQNHQFLGVNNAIASMLAARQAGARARGRVLADAGQRQEFLDGVLRAEGAAQGGGQLDVRGRD